MIWRWGNHVCSQENSGLGNSNGCRGSRVATSGNLDGICIVGGSSKLTSEITAGFKVGGMLLGHHFDEFVFGIHSHIIKISEGLCPLLKVQLCMYLLVICLQLERLIWV